MPVDGAAKIEYHDLDIGDVGVVERQAPAEPGEILVKGGDSRLRRDAEEAPAGMAAGGSSKGEMTGEAIAGAGPIPKASPLPGKAFHRRTL